MNIKTSVEILSEVIGFEIGTSDDVTQSNLLNGFFGGLNDSILDDRSLDMQLCYIADKLSDKSIKVLNRLVEFTTKKQK